MSTFVIGDIQGCYAGLQKLLEHIRFDPAHDCLWTTGDLVNRGPASLEVLRLFKSLGDSAVIVLGNHDLHLLAVAYGYQPMKAGDTLEAILQASDCQDLLFWLRHLPLVHHDKDKEFTLLHAGVAPQWTLADTLRYAKEIEGILRHDEDFHLLLTHLYGNKPDIWDDNLRGWDRARFITNCLTRLRYCDGDGRLLWKNKLAPVFKKSYKNSEERPWFLVEHRKTQKNRILCGHWSTLGYYANNNVYALDTGCLWGGELTALRLEDLQRFSVACEQSAKIVR